jgi:hypothetical protein
MAPIAPSGTPIVVGRFKKPEDVFTGGPEHAMSYTWQLASNVAIIYPDSGYTDKCRNQSKKALPLLERDM